jgi:hypothetical protein
MPVTFGARPFRRNAELRRDVAAIVLLSWVALVCLTLCMDRTVGVFDEGLILFGATRVLDGAVPHRDFLTLYGPGQFYVLAGLFKLFGVSVLVERAWDTAVRWCCVVLVMIVVRQAAPRWLAVLAAIASLVWLASFGAYGFPVFPALAAALAGLAFLVPALARGGPASRLTAAGICAGIGMLFRYDIGIATFGSECAILAFSGWALCDSGTSCFRTVLRSIGWFGAGFAVVVVPVAIAYADGGVIPDLIFQVITYPARFYVKTRSLPFPGLWPPVPLIREAVYLPLVVCVAAVPTLILLARYAPDNRSASDDTGPLPSAQAIMPWSLLGLVDLTLVFFGKGVVRASIDHMAMALITSIALTGVLARPVPGRGPLGRFMVMVAVAATCMLTLLIWREDLPSALSNVAWAGDPASWQLAANGMPPASGSCRAPADLQRIACFAISPDTIETVRYVRQRTSADDPVFVGLSRHDRIFVNGVLLYFVMNRRPATKWYEFDPGLQTSAPIQQEMVGELRRVKPPLIVLQSDWDAVREPNDSALSSGVTILDDYLRGAFEQVATFGTNTVLRARSSPQP